MTLWTPVLRTLAAAFGLPYHFLSISFGSYVLALCKPILPRAMFVKLGIQLQHWYLSAFVWGYERNKNLQIRISGDTVPCGESALVLSNHINHDWAPLYSLALRAGMLGNVRGVLKYVTKLIPGWGHAMWLMDWPFLKRNWESDRQTLTNHLDQYRRDKVPVHIWCFPEGTRLTPDKLAASEAFSRERNLPVLRHVMNPRVKGFIALAQGLHGVVDYVYETTIAYSGWTNTGNFQGPGIAQLAFPAAGRQHTLHVHVRRIRLADLPLDSEKALSAWCYESFQRRDQLLEQYFRDGQFPGENTARPFRVGDWLPGFLFYSAGSLSLIGLIRSLWRRRSLA